MYRITLLIVCSFLLFGCQNNDTPKQAAFGEIISRYSEQYFNTNAIKKEEAVQGRKKEFVSFLGDGLKVTNWTGKVYSSDSSKDSVYLVISCDDKKYKIYTNSISNKSKLYPVIRDINDGDYVIFSGNFKPDPEKGIRERSWTVGGSMELPELSFNLTNIAKNKSFF